MQGREGMKNHIHYKSPLTTAIHLYNGFLYNSTSDLRDLTIESIQSDRIDVFIISAGYGIVNALELLHDYEAEMKGEIADHWLNHNLVGIITDLLVQKKPEYVLGFFSGTSEWETQGSKYRYFFENAVNSALNNGLEPKIAGCFNRRQGFEAKDILGALGRTYAEFIRRLSSGGPDEQWIEQIRTQGRRDSGVIVGFNRLA